jgi:CheY-like chemotaxis protein
MEDEPAPAAQPNPDPPETAAPGLPSGPPPDRNAAARLRGERILVVDDSLVLRRVLSRTLAGFGAIVGDAADGKAALAALRQAVKENSPYAVVILDIEMPVMDGKNALRGIREDSALAGTRVLMHTTASERKRVMECAGLGVSGFLVKPARTDRLVEAIAAALDAPAVEGGGSGRSARLRELRERVLAAAREAIAAGESTADRPEADRIVGVVLEWTDHELTRAGADGGA